MATNSEHWFLRRPANRPFGSSLLVLSLIRHGWFVRTLCYREFH